jgi:hypothetical protein
MRSDLRLTLAMVVAFGTGWTLSSCGSSSNSGTTPGNGLFACKGTSCSSSELSTYESCVTSHCGDTLKSCFGPGALSGNFSGGQCGDYIGCVQKCGCSPSLTCLQACGEPSQACTTCSQMVDTCENGSGCSKPACFGGGSGSDAAVVKTDGGSRDTSVSDSSSFSIPDALPGFDGNLGGLLDALGAPATCDDLLSCCNGMAAGPGKEQCMTAYTASKAQGDAICMLVVNSYKLAGTCH